MTSDAVTQLFGRAKTISDPPALHGYEHAYQGVRPSGRTTPSGAVVWAYNEIKARNLALRRVVDLGCGKGRNSIFFAEKGADVTALDFAPGAIAALKISAKMRGFSSKIRALVYDVTDSWPVPEHSVDFVSDAFCFKHIIGREARLAYKQNLVRALDMRGTYLVSFASIGDGYYGKYIVEHYGDGSALVLDPATNLQSVLFTRDHVREFFAPEFKLLTEKFAERDGRARGQEQPRHTYAMLFARNPKSQGGGYIKITPETESYSPRFYGEFKSDER
ncbi:MAG: class I SAM-dependent methyltransferase [Alphaproteobacteria bacterium]